ncbi:hypothetical protein BH23CHL1_BH23CHL1_05340 [soil metagenome]
MRVERLSLLLLALIAVVMGVNYVSASSRFLHANRAFQELTLELDSFTYRNPQSPVYYAITIGNPANTEVEVIAIRTTLHSGLQLVGGGEIRAAEVLATDESTTYEVTARISDVSLVERAESEGPIKWIVRGEVLVRLDLDMTPVWIQFSADAVSS